MISKVFFFVVRKVDLPDTEELTKNCGKPDLSVEVIGSQERFQGGF